ncbi:hypothetical protein D3C80_1432130 [compost metagenome]
MNACSQNSGQLSFEQWFAIKADTNCTIPQNRIIFFWEVKILKLLISAYIERSDDYRMVSGILSNLTINIVLLFFARKIRSIHI